MEPREKLQEIASELLLHLRWAQAKGMRHVPPPRLDPPAAVEAAPSEAPARMAPAPEPPPVAARAHAAAAADTLEAIRRDIGDCTRCKLCRGRTNIVFGSGNPRARLVFVGEGPGVEEDAQGLPFVGAAGQLLTRMIQAMGLRREEVYICNVVKCRPPNNRNPEPDEVAACSPFLARQIRAIAPKAIVTLGKFAAQTLLETSEPVSRLRGRWHRYEGIDLLPTFHPAYLLRSPHEKRKAWEDLQQVMRRLGLPPR